MVLTIWGKIAIGTSFGLLPAVRVVVRSGPYRFIRHPIYVTVLLRAVLIDKVGFGYDRQKAVPTPIDEGGFDPVSGAVEELIAFT